MTTGSIDGRTRHYGTFYGLDPADSRDGTSADDQRPLLLVWGNCQAEAVRVLLAGSTSLQFRTVRVPPVFELTQSDLPHLIRLMSEVRLLLTQPVKDHYRELPLGSDEISGMMPPGGNVIRWPVIRFSGFHPFQVIIRDPWDESRDPPLVPYHDLRTLASARHNRDLLGADVPVAARSTVATASKSELRRREEAMCDVAISDLFDQPQPGDMFTINHPGNRVLVELVHRVQLALGTPADAADPGRDLLGEVAAPMPAVAVAALGLSSGASSTWRVRGDDVPDSEVHRVQWQWYRDNPRLVEAGYARHQQTLQLLGLV
jgi:hypothetical protein